MANNAKNFMNKARTIINNNNNIIDKFNSLQYEAALVVDTGISGIISNITESKNRAINIRGRVECGGTGNLDNYIQKLK